MQYFGGNHNLESEQRRKLRKDAFFDQSSTFRVKSLGGTEIQGRTSSCTTHQNMAAQRIAKTMCGSNASPKTPSNTTMTETVPLHITPMDPIDSERDPDTPHKESSYKKKSGKLVSKRKLFLQSGQNLHINKAKRHASPKIPNAATLTPRPPDGSRPHFPLTERQQLQYLLEVTAKEAKQDSESSSNDDLPVITNRAAKKDTSKDNLIEARIRKRNERGETALHVAAIRGDLEDVVALIKAGALVNAKDNAGWTPLHEACNYGNLSIVQELVWSGADVNSPGYEDITPLHDAVINDHVKVVKFLLDNGADSKLQTSQNYSASDLARSEPVLSLLSPEEKSRDYYSIEPQDSHPNPEFSHPSHNLPEVKINGFNSSFIQRSSYDDRFDQVIDAKNSFPQGFSFQGAQGVKVHINPQENFGVNGNHHIDKQELCVQSFPAVYAFPGNAYQFTDETEVSKEREAIDTRLLSKEVVENNNKVQGKEDYGAWHFQEPPCDGVSSDKLQLNGKTEVVKKVSEAASSEDHVQNLVVESTSAPTYPNSLEGLVDEDLDQVHVNNLLVNKPGLTVTSESEEDTVRPEKLNECLDKAMIQISSYLETSQKVDVQVPCDKTDLNKCNNSQLKNNKPQSGKTMSNEFVIVEVPQKHDPMETSSNFDNCQEDHPSVGSSFLKRMECKEDHIKVFAEEVNTDATNCAEQQPHMNFTKIKPRNEKKKDSGVSERSGKSGRRKRSSTRSSDISKSENNQGLRKEECTSHIPNPSWRLGLHKYRYSMSSIPISIPGYEDFLINSKNSESRSKSSSNEIIKDPAQINQLEKLISQHDTEKVKLRMTLEQELVRLFGNCARKSAGYQVPYSACAVISSQMRAPGMKQLSTEKEQPLSIKLEVEKILCKFNRLKTEMLRRHNREIEVVFALENFWSQNEGLNGPSRSSTRTWKDFSEDFDLLPPKFNDYYEEVLCATD